MLYGCIFYMGWKKWGRGMGKQWGRGMSKPCGVEFLGIAHRREYGKTPFQTHP